VIQLSNIHLRRVYWAIFSPSLLSYPFNAQYIQDDEHGKSVVDLLHRLDANPSNVDTHFTALGHMPMGKYFEQLVFFMLQHDNRYELILANHQVKEGNRTLGELDLILKDTITGLLEHWEICLKYYLQSQPSDEHHVMLGPNAIDNLACGK